MKSIPRSVIGRRMVITSTNNDFENDTSKMKKGLTGYIILGANPVTAVALDGSDAKFSDRDSVSCKDIGVSLRVLQHRAAKYVLGSAADVRDYLDSVFLKSEYDLTGIQFLVSESDHDPNAVIRIYFGRVIANWYGDHELNCKGRYGHNIIVSDLNRLLTYQEMVDAVVKFFTPYFVQEEGVKDPEYILDLHVDKFKGTKSELIKELRDLITSPGNSDGCIISRSNCITATLNTVKEPKKFQFDPEDKKADPAYVVVVTKNCGLSNERTYVLGPYNTRKAANKAAREETIGRALDMNTIVYKIIR